MYASRFDHRLEQSLRSLGRPGPKEHLSHIVVCGRFGIASIVSRIEDSCTRQAFTNGEWPVTSDADAGKPQAHLEVTDSLHRDLLVL